MRDLTQTRRYAPSERSLGLRLLAVLALLLVSVASTVQVCHGHENALPGLSRAAATAGSSAGHSTPAAPPTNRQNAPEDHCPLCVAMHSAMPASSQVELNQLVTLAHITSSAVEAERLFRWRFELLSRPPPAIHS